MSGRHVVAAPFARAAIVTLLDGPEPEQLRAMRRAADMHRRRNIVWNVVEYSDAAFVPDLTRGTWPAQCPARSGHIPVPGHPGVSRQFTCTRRGRAHGSARSWCRRPDRRGVGEVAMTATTTTARLTATEALLAAAAAETPEEMHAARLALIAVAGASVHEMDHSLLVAGDGSAGNRLLGGTRKVASWAVRASCAIRSYRLDRRMELSTGGDPW